MLSANRYKKTRIAPTPSGLLHLGNVLSFAITAALARKNGAKILLKVDDLDRARVNKQYVHDIFGTLTFLRIPWDEGPQNNAALDDRYSQLHRLPMYRQALQQLADKGMVFACSCSRKQLLNPAPCSCLAKKIPLSAQNASWRLITGNNHQLTVKNYDGQQTQTALPAEMHDFIVKKRDGLPAYQLTSVIDDLFYGTDLVVRGEDLWPSTLAQLALASALGENRFNNITFYHHPLLFGPSGTKLSKSAGATSIKYLRENGKSAADVFGIIASTLGIEGEIDSWEQLGRIISTCQYKRPE